MSKRVLVLGGSGFVGTHIVQAFVNRGWCVNVVCRGVTQNCLPNGVRVFHVDRQSLESFADISDTHWDVCVDLCGYLPKTVRKNALLLSGHVGHYIFFSAVRAFLPSENLLTEQSPLRPAAADNQNIVDSESYGAIKVACENELVKAFSSRLTILRPQVVFGRGDHSGRLNYWYKRALNDGPSLLPGDGDDCLQVVDVQDVAKFSVHVAENKITGSFNLSGHRVTWRRFVELLGIKEGVWIPSEIIQQHGLGFRELPLFRLRGSAEDSYMNVSSEKARRHGFCISDVDTTIFSIAQWFEQDSVESGLPVDVAAEQLSVEKEHVIIHQFASAYLVGLRVEHARG